MLFSFSSDYVASIKTVTQKHAFNKVVLSGSPTKATEISREHLSDTRAVRLWNNLIILTIYLPNNNNGNSTVDSYTVGK